MENKTNSKRLKINQKNSQYLSYKSLIGFIAIGVIAGLILGMYLIDVKNTSQLVYVEGSSISIVTEKFDFKKGEEIKIRIINSGTIPLIFSDSSYGLQITGLSGMLMYKPETIGSGKENYSLDSNEEIVFVWNQMKTDGEFAHEGLYKIKAKGFDPDGNIVESSTTITIWK